MIYITGDIHGNIDIHKLNTKNFPEQKNLTKNDYLIICGDFGLIWYGPEKDEYWLNWLNNKPWTTLFVDGNHENFDLLNKYPIESWNGGKIHKIKDSIFHLMRGEIFEIEDKSFFCMGGAKSADISDGILQKDDKEKINLFNKLNKSYRIEGVSWWKDEIPTEQEYEYGINNLEKHNKKVDYIISHTCSSKLINVFDNYPILAYQSSINSYFNMIQSLITFDKWFFGHFHDNINLGKYHMLYDNIIKLK